jgi:hypothetical protein
MQLPHFGEFAASNAKNAAHAWECAPFEHACSALAISVIEQTFWCVGTPGVIRFGSQPAYGAGQTVCGLAHPRGEALPLQTREIALQSWQLPPNCPHALSRKPGSHCPPESQHPAQFEGVHDGGGGDMGAHTNPVPAKSVQSRPVLLQFWQTFPFDPQATGLLPPRHTLPWQQPGHVDGEQTKLVPLQERVVALQVVTGPWVVQSRQSAPPVPQAVSAVPPRHLPCAAVQHPVGQFD